MVKYSVLSLYIAILAVIAPHIIAKTVTVPAQKTDSVLQLKVGQKYDLKLPKFKFQGVRRRHISQVGQKQNKLFPYCQVIRQQITFSVIDKLFFENVPPKPLLVWKFQDIQYQKSVLDAILLGSEIYVFFQDGTVVYVKAKEGKFMNSIIMNIKLQEGQKIQSGYFVHVGQKLVFISEKYAVLVQKEKCTILQGYEPIENFQTAIQVKKHYFMAVGRNGFKVYQFDKVIENKIAQISQFTFDQKQKSVQHAIVDALYDQKIDALLILDQFNGLFQFTLSNKGVFTGDKKNILTHNNCQIMNINDQTHTLNMLCGYLYEIDILQWPKVKEISIVNTPGLNIEEMYSSGPLTAFIGRDAFRIKYWGQDVDYFQDQNLDRLIFSKNYYVSVSEDSLYFGIYRMHDPYVRCKVNDQQKLGDHMLVFETKAECNQTYFRQKDVDMLKLDIDQGDLCMYSIHQPAHIWSEGKILIAEIQIFGAIFGIILVGGLIFIGYKKWDLHKTEIMYKQFALLNETKPVAESAQNQIKEELDEPNKKTPTLNAGTNQSESQIKDQEPDNTNKDQADEYQMQ